MVITSPNMTFLIFIFLSLVCTIVLLLSFDYNLFRIIIHRVTLNMKICGRSEVYEKMNTIKLILIYTYLMITCICPHINSCLLSTMLFLSVLKALYNNAQKHRLTMNSQNSTFKMYPEFIIIGALKCIVFN